MIKNLFLILIAFFTVSKLEAQEGCTDPQADNYDVSATINDGSCTYPTTSGSLTLVAGLPSEMVEVSGLMHSTSQGLWAHNDASNPNEIYELDSMTGEILHTALVIGDNIDWEDMAESEDHLFLGDFGNNPGNREDLKIYRLNKSELGNNIMNTQVIEFSYSDQVDFSENWNNNDYDCEAFIYHNDSLHLFTKNWVDNQTRHYVLPAEPGSYSAELRETFDTDGLVTGADVNDEGVIVLLGYTEVGFTFMWLLFDYPEYHIFEGNKRRIELGTALTNSQTEGIAFRNQTEGFVCSEQFDVGQTELPPKLLNFSIEEWVTVTSGLAEKVPASVQIYPNPFEEQIHLSFTSNQNELYSLSLVDALGSEVWRKEQLLTRENELTGLPHLSPGLYTLIVHSQSEIWYKKLIKK